MSGDDLNRVTVRRAMQGYALRQFRSADGRSIIGPMRETWLTVEDDSGPTLSQGETHVTVTWGELVGAFVLTGEPL